MRILLLAVAFSVAADERRDLLDALRQAELALEMSRRSLPPSFNSAEEVRFFSRVAEQLGFKADIRTLPAVEKSGDLVLHRVEVSGPVGDRSLSDYLSIVAIRDYRAGDLETLRADETRFTARFVLPVYERGAPILDLRKELERLHATKAAIDRMKWSRLRDAAALLDFDESRAVRITGVRVDGEATIEGVLVGVPARKALLGSIEKAGFGATRLRMSPSGACRSFALTARRGAAETQTVFDLAASPLCEVESEPVAGPVAAKGSDGLTLRFRGIDIADLFFVLHDLTEANFVIDADVKGRVDVDVEKASLEEVLTAIRAAGFVVGPGPLHRVSRPNAAAPQSKDYEGEPVGLVLSDVLVRDILCIYKDITGLDFRTPPGLATRVNVFVKGRPWDETLDMVLAGARLPYRIDGTRVLVGENATASACESFLTSPFAGLRPKLDELGAADLTLAGVAGTKAYAYGPWRQMLTLEPGARVFDGKVTSVAATGVRIAMDGGLVFDLPLAR